MEKTQYLNTERVPVSNNKAFRKLIIFAKRLVRKSMRWYVRPPLMQQSEFNRHCLHAVRNMQALLARQQAEIEALQKLRAKDAETAREHLSMMNRSLAEQRRLIESLRGAQGALRTRKTQQEAARQNPQDGQ